MNTITRKGERRGEEEKSRWREKNHDEDWELGGCRAIKGCAKWSHENLAEVRV